MGEHSAGVTPAKLVVASWLQQPRHKLAVATACLWLGVWIPSKSTPRPLLQNLSKLANKLAKQGRRDGYENSSCGCSWGCEAADLVVVPVACFGARSLHLVASLCRSMKQRRRSAGRSGSGASSEARLRADKKRWLKDHAALARRCKSVQQEILNTVYNTRSDLKGVRGCGWAETPGAFLKFAFAFLANLTWTTPTFRRSPVAFHLQALSELAREDEQMQRQRHQETERLRHRLDALRAGNAALRQHVGTLGSGPEYVSKLQRSVHRLEVGAWMGGWVDSCAAFAHSYTMRWTGKLDGISSLTARGVPRVDAL